MNIVASRKDDILKRKAEYDAKRAEYDAAISKFENAYYDAQDAITNPVKEKLTQALSAYSALSFDDITVEPQSRFRGTGLRIRIRCNENHKFNDDVALSWSYDVSLDKDGNVIKDSSSWSGLKATTEAQMKSLRQTVSALEYLNDLDWRSMLNVELPKYEDYIDKDLKVPYRENFEQQLEEVDIEELIGTNRAIKVRSWEGGPYGGDVYVQILGESPSQYSVRVIPTYKDWIESKEKIDRFARACRMRKSTFSSKVYRPFEIIDLPQE